ncbi:MAG: hypothetical protein KGH98_01910 [Candidatus Micrarchaeota archaeon]|nr:hypothetical protein [Candidatus Micrarchaeota archaeon]
MITGFTISTIEGKVESIDSLQKQRFPRLNINLEKVTSEQDKVKVFYTFVADYFDGDANSKASKSVGQLKIGGFVEVKDSKDAIGTIMKKWDDTKTLPIELAEEIINGLNFRCSATGTLVAYGLGLIPPMVISQTKIQEQK